MKKSPSLLKRLSLASLLILPIVIGFSSYALNRAYVRGLDSAEYEALLSQIYALLAIAEPGSSGIVMPNIMANPRFETPESGLYARVLNQHATPNWQSNSLANLEFTLPTQTLPKAGTIREYWFDGAHPASSGTPNANQNKSPLSQYRSLIFTTIWEVDGKDMTFSFEVIHAQDKKLQEIKQYQRALLIWLSGMALILLAFQIAITLWGLRPLKLLAKEIEQIERGDANSLSGTYPAEIQPVTTSLNKLVDSESRQRERYKNSLSDLAHSLKTPLSVIRAQLDNSEQARSVDEQVERMSEIINHQLRRASAQVQTLYGPSTAARPLVQRLFNALGKVYQDKNIVSSTNIDATITLAMNEDDGLEVLGNIIENAFKYGRHSVKVSAEEKPDCIQICVSDDGPGVDKALSDTILQRGARADTSKSGQGIGLAIAVDILSSYNGALTIARSDSGGASFQITVPK